MQRIQCIPWVSGHIGCCHHQNHQTLSALQPDPSPQRRQANHEVFRRPPFAVRSKVQEAFRFPTSRTPRETFGFTVITPFLTSAARCPRTPLTFRISSAAAISRTVGVSPWAR